ncbi:hypothetical protein BSKO_08007 [Bryopsis sp. KO-2023]|nr:hypothetical protein BSKO_08007 [Bryopsis sp. KO-2023]
MEGGGQHQCVICYNPTTDEGSHRLVSIKCGHVFGEKCIRKWFDIKPECPLCSEKWKLRDLRYHYGTKMGNEDIDKLRMMEAELRKARQKSTKRKRLLKNAKIKLVNVNQSLALMASRNAKLSRDIKKLRLKITEKEKIRKVPERKESVSSEWSSSTEPSETSTLSSNASSSVAESQTLTTSSLCSS